MATLSTKEKKDLKLRDIEFDSPIDVIKEFLKANEYKSTLDCFEAEIKYRIINNTKKVLFCNKII